MSKAKFDKAVQIIQSLPKDGPIQPSTQDRLYFYKYFKQADVGDVNVPRPSGMFDFEGKAKWDAWKEVEGTSTEDAYRKYVERFLELLKASGDDQAVKEYLAAVDAA